jgi:hypothetical protein
VNWIILTVTHGDGTTESFTLNAPAGATISAPSAQAPINYGYWNGNPSTGAPPITPVTPTGPVIDN